jgi:hypothetical protein
MIVNNFKKLIKIHVKTSEYSKKKKKETDGNV